MKKYLSVVLLALAATLMYSCEQLIPVLKLTSNEEISFPATGGSGTIYYSLTGAAASGSVMAVADTWITDLNYGVSGRVTFNVTPNESTSPRVGKVTVSYTTQSFQVTINQAGKEEGPDQPGEGGGDEPDQPGEGGGDEPDQPGDGGEGGDDEPFTPDVTWKAAQIHGSYMGDADGYYKSNSYSLYLSDNGIQPGNMPEKPNSTYMHVSFYSDTEFDPDTKLIPYGTYTYDATKEDVDGNISKYSQGYYQTNDKGYINGDNYKFASGTMTVSPQGIIIEMTDNTGVKREITYQGAPLLNSPEADEPSNDVNITDGYLTGYFYRDSEDLYEYSLYFSEVEVDLENEDIPSRTPHSPIIIVDAFSMNAPVDGARMPNGTYIGADSGEHGTIEMDDSCLIFTDATGMPDTENYIEFTDAKLVVNGKKLTFEAEDAEGNKYTAVYEGDYALIDDNDDVPGSDDIQVINFGETVAQGGYTYDPSDAEAPYPIWAFEATPTSGDGYGLFMYLMPEQEGFDQSNLAGIYESLYVDQYFPAYQGWLTTWEDAEEVDDVELMGDITVSVVGETLQISYSDDDMQFTWEGEVAWTNESPEQGGYDEYVERTDAILNGWYDGIATAGDNSYHYYDIWFSNGGVTIENDKVQLSVNSWYYETILLLDKAPVNGRIPNGTYEFTGSIAYNTVYAGQVVETNSTDVSYNKKYADAVMKVTDAGITLEVVDVAGKYHVISYTGNNYTLEGEYGDGGDEPDQPGGDDEEDVLFWYVGVESANLEYWGNGNWYIQILPEGPGNGFALDFVANENGMDANLSGTYAPASDYSTPMTYLEGFISDEGSVFGSNFIQVQDGGSIAVVPFESTDVEFTANPDGTYSIYYETEFLPDYGFKILLDWTGYLTKQNKDEEESSDFEYEAPHIAGTVRGTASNGNTVYGIQLDNMANSKFGNLFLNSYAYHISIASPNAPENINCFDAPAGTYQIVNNQDWAAGTAVVQYREANDSEVIRNVVMVSGTVTVAENGVAALDMVDEEGNTHSVTYLGSTHIDAVYSTMTEDFTPAEAFTGGTMSIGDWGDLDASGAVKNAKSTRYVQLQLGDKKGVLLFSDTSSMADGEIATGTYNIKHVSDSISEKTVWAGEVSGGIYYSFIGTITSDGMVADFALLDNGTVTVSKSGSEYTIEVDGYNEDVHNPKKIKYTWKGTVAAAAQVSSPAQNVAKIAPDSKVVTKTSAKVNADMKRAQKPALKARGKLKGAPKQETRRIEDLMRSEFVVR
ncbi:MAG: BACON domain-containing protein [Tidjanibacter sp.]|nr:BACON domain-containing protein [Tidjanibacter sp.]